MIDFVVESREQLLARLDGREVRRPDGSAVVLSLRDATVVEHRLRWLEDVKNVVLQPAILAMLLSLAVLGIYVELIQTGPFTRSS